MKRLITTAGAVVALVSVLAWQGQAQTEIEGPREKVFTVADLPVNDISDKVHLRVVSGDMGSIGFLNVDMGSVTALHTHPAEQFTYIVSGKLKYYIEDREYILNAGDLIVVPSYVPHGNEALEDTVTIESFAPMRPEFADFAK